MKVNIPEPVIYMGIGKIANSIVKDIFGNTIKDVVDDVLNDIINQQRLNEIEAKRIVDVMGDTVGYIDDKGFIIKGD